MGLAVSWGRYQNLLKNAQLFSVRGRVTELTGLVIKAAVPNVRVGELCYIKGRGRAAIRAEVVGFQGDEVMLMPLGELRGIGPDSEVLPTGRPLSIRVGDALLGRVLNGLGEPIDGRPLPQEGLMEWSVDRDCPDPFKRQRILKPLPLGVRCIDGLLTVGEGQRIGLFAGSGVGKSTLMGQIARNTAAELAVIALIGERGREVLEFVEDALGEGLKRSIVVCATSDQPSLVRLRAAFVATSIAEYFRERGGNVLFMLDTVTRLARAQREIGLAIGEPPARQGYPPSVFSMLPKILERTGNSEKGKCTAIYTVLVAGGDMEEPIADEVRGILDGHFILNRTLAERNQWPAMDVLASLSRVMNQVVKKEHRAAAGKLRETLATYEKQRDLILLGAYQYGTDPRTDYAIDKYDAIIEFLKQSTASNVGFEETAEALVALFEE
ncbi:MAG: type III secretion system ATPase SctN [Proteobacteria bacterium]|nr:type III secretion system ATPase SctN [Cystobacterineae bacterium]MCL2258759.1 type III secretion system ATPase SctN [Cystobacterineae bacterium]MCL2314378.1 type III secretion system ATPase SctN [Pseudomonadota bacterium]